MKTLIRKLLLRATTGIILVTSGTYALFATINYFLQAIHETFYLSAVFIAVAPALTFISAFAYHYWVVGPLKQICAIDPRGLTDIHKVLIDCAREVIGFARIIPIIFSVLALVMAVIIAPGILIAAGIQPGNTLQAIFVSALVAGQLLLAVRISRQIVHAIRYLRNHG